MKRAPDTLVRADILAARAYPVADATGMIKLDLMENPYPLAEALRAELGRVLAGVAINRYPDADGNGLKPLLAEAFGIPSQARVLLGNGSDEIIALLTQLVARPGASVMSVEPSFVMYRMCAQQAGMTYLPVVLNDDFTLDLPRLLEAVRTHQPSLLFLAYPNNPTGNRFARKDIEAVLDAATGLVVIDEAYQPFADDSLMDLAGTADNLLVMRTVSKIGMAGLRLGYVAGPQGWIAELEKIRPPFNVNVLTLAAVRFLLQHRQVFAEQAAWLRRDRALLADALARLPGVTVFPSEANFITVRVPDAVRAFEGLRRGGILVKNLHGAHPLLANCLRLTVGTPEQVRALADQLALCLE